MKPYSADLKQVVHFREDRSGRFFLPPCLSKGILGRQEYQQFGICLLLQLTRLDLNPFLIPW